MMLKTCLLIGLLSLSINARRLAQLPQEFAGGSPLTSSSGHHLPPSAFLSPSHIRNTSTATPSASASASSLGSSSTPSLAASRSSFIASNHASSTKNAPVITSVGTAFPTATPTPATMLDKRAAIPACLKTVELSCLNLAANCIDSVTADTRNTLWSIRSCVAAATCYGVGDLITSVNCQTGFSVTNSDEASLNYTNIYASIVGSCAFASGGCPVTQQNYIDFYYGTLTAINTANFPSSSSVVIAFWTAITAWTATGNTVPYTNLNDWFHFSSFPATPTTTSAPVVTTFSNIYWNPNPSPPTNAVSETFVGSGSTTTIAVPTNTTTVVIAGATLTLDPGGQPIGGPVPTGITMPGAVTPTWNNNPIPPSAVPTVTFTATPTFTTAVPVPTSSNAPPINVTGPPGDKSSDGSDWWLIFFGPSIVGLIPVDVGIIGGIIPLPVPPLGWSGPWVNPAPPPQSSASSSSSSSSSTSTSSCPAPTAPYNLPDDPENVDWQDLGTDPNARRKRSIHLLPRASPRHVSVPRCGLSADSSSAVQLGAGIYWTVGTKAGGGTNTGLSQINVGGRPGNGADTPQEHVFELGYINQFFTPQNDLDCTWLTNNIFNYVRANGGTMGTSLSDSIDQTPNMVWVDKPLNQAKSNVVNKNRADPNTPPQQAGVDSIADFTTSASTIQDIEYFIRNFGALAQYFSVNGNRFKATAERVQALLAEITPDVAINPSLPTRFNTFIRNLIAAYPNGISSRAVNIYNYYVSHMNGLSTTLQRPVPQCYAVYQDSTIPGQPIRSRLQNQNFNFALLMPTTPTLPGCDGPGTLGRFSVGFDANGQPIFITVPYRIMGSGNSQFWALGSGTSIGGVHFLAGDLGPTFGNACSGIFEIGEGTPAAGVPDANILVNCGGLAGRVNAPFNAVVNGQQLSCLLYNHNDGTNAFDIVCGPSQAATNTCLQQVVIALQATHPNAAISIPNFFFFPN